MAHNAKRYQYAQSSGSTSLHFCPLADCNTIRDRALFRQRIERDYKPQLGAKAMGIYSSIWRCANNSTFEARISIQRLMEDNGIKSKGGLYPHLDRLEQAGLVEIHRQFTLRGTQRANTYVLLDPYLPKILTPISSENAPILDNKSLPYGERDLLFLDLEEIYASEPARDDAQSPPPQLSQAAAAGDTGISAEVVVEDKKERLVTEKPVETSPVVPLVNETTPAVPLVNDVDTAFAPLVNVHAPVVPLVNDVDVAFALIPDGEQQTWYDRAIEALVTSGVAEALRIVPVVRDMAFRLWIGSTIPGLATG